MLQQRESQLVIGLQEMYRRLLDASAWHGSPLELVGDKPLTHDILSALNVLKHEGEFDAARAKSMTPSIAGACGYAEENTGSGSSYDEHLRPASTLPMPMEVDQRQQFQRSNLCTATSPLAQYRAPAPAKVLFPHYQSTFVDVAHQAAMSSLDNHASSMEDAASMKEWQTSDTGCQSHTVFRTSNDPMFATLKYG
jgi:hypothetical protein